MITRRQRDELFLVLTDAGLDMTSMDLKNDAVTGTTIWDRVTDSFFCVASLDDGELFRVFWSVAEGPRQSPETSRTWKSVPKSARDWASELRYVAERPDLWAQLERSRELLVDAAESGAGNSPFTPSEQAQIAGRIDKAKERAHEDTDLTEAHAAAIERKLDELLDASQRVGRKDWLVMLQGTAFSLLVADVVPQHVVAGIITTVLSAVGHIFGIGGSPPMVSA